MSDQHTQRRLVVSSQNDYPTGAAQFDGVTAHTDVFVLYHDNAKADARRLVACWNACIDFDTDSLEDDAPNKLREDRDSLLAQRDELLKAVEALIKYDDRGADGGLELLMFLYAEAIKKARAAIAKVKDKQ